MKNNLLKALLIILIILPAVGYAESEEAYKKVKNQIAKQEKEIQKLQKNQAGTAKQIEALQKQQGDIRKAVTMLSGRISENNTRIATLQHQQKDLETQSKAYETQARKGMIFLMDNSDALIPRTVMAGEDPARTAALVELLGIVNRNMHTRIKEHALSLIELEKVRQELVKTNSALQQNRQDNEKMLADFDKTRRELDSKLTLLKHDTKAQQEYLALLKKEQDRIDKALKQRAKKNINPGNTQFARSKGNLPYPMTGRIVEPFGETTVANTGIKIMRKGIKIQPTGNGTVQAVDDGQVVFADNIGGQNIVILQHDAEYFTVYGNLDEYSVNVSQNIHKNAYIGRINIDLKGDSSYLNFEIRRHEQAVDPAPWLKRS